MDGREDAAARVGDRTSARQEMPITPRTVTAALAGGTLGTAAMVPVLVTVPQLLGVFRAEPVFDFARIAVVVGVEPSFAVGAGVFLFGGAVTLPLLFLVAGSFLPPRNAPLLRGPAFASVVWTGFAVAFWPDGEGAVVASFLVFSVLAHWVYGFVLAWTLVRFAWIPEHAV